MKPRVSIAGPATTDDQYSLRKILFIWAAAVIPMVLLGWGASAMVGDSLDLGVGDDNREVFSHGVFLTLGLIWQFVLVLIIIRSEEGDLSWSTVRGRCWLNAPKDSYGRTNRKLWWWLVPLIVLFGVWQFVPLSDAWNSLVPFLGEPAKYSFDDLLNSPERKAELEGAWQVVGLFVVLGIFNTVIGEELLFRGVLLPKMNGAFGERDWLANGVLFGLYHLHQPWTIIHSIVDGTFLLALPSRRFQSAWIGIIVHSSQSVFFVLIALWLVLGRA